MPSSTPIRITPPIATPAIATSVQSVAARARHWGSSTSPRAAEMITAPSTVFGRYEIGPVRKSRIRITIAYRGEPRHLRAGAHAVVDGRARVAPTDRESLADPGGHARHAHREQLLRRVDVLAPLPGERAGGEDLVGQRQDEDPDRGRHELDELEDRRRRERRRRQARRDVSDDRDAVRLQVEGIGEGDRSDDHDQLGREAAREAAQHEQDRKRGDADRRMSGRWRCRSRWPPRAAGAPGPRR